jgi:hypothetical protein
VRWEKPWRKIAFSCRLTKIGLLFSGNWAVSGRLCPKEGDIARAVYLIRVIFPFPKANFKHKRLYSTKGKRNTRQHKTMATYHRYHDNMVFLLSEYSSNSQSPITLGSFLAIRERGGNAAQ